MAEQKQDGQLEHTSSSSVRIRDVALKTCQRRLTIGRSGERGSGISVLAAQHHDDENEEGELKFSLKILIIKSSSCLDKWIPDPDLMVHDPCIKYLDFTLGLNN